jgi:hypothetical protein
MSAAALYKEEGVQWCGGQVHAELRHAVNVEVPLLDAILGGILEDLHVAGDLREWGWISSIMKLAMHAEICRDAAVESALAQLCGATRMP